METETKKESAASPWHALEREAVLRQLGVETARGLSGDEAARRLQTWGVNLLPRGKKTPPAVMFLRQFGSPLVYILLVAAALTGWIGEYADMSVILLVVGVNAVIGFFQEYRANGIFEKLQAIVRVEALVKRDGKLTKQDSEGLVPGDIILLKTGAKIPADARVLRATNLETNEAILTGESTATAKTAKTVPGNATPAHQKNIAFMGTVVETGEGEAVVVATGARTEIGKLSLLAQTTRTEPSPLQQRMQKLATFLTELFVGVAAAIFLIGILAGDPLVQMIKTTIAAAVAAIPEGLPAAISIILAVASKKILERKGLVRRLIATETLGSASVICTDKTGTLTYGSMRIEQILAADPGTALLCMALANEAVVEETAAGRVLHGEATDRAKLVAFLDSGANFEQTLKALPRLALFPFHAGKKYLASFHYDETQGSIRLFLSGAPEAVIRLCQIPESERKTLEKTYENLARQGFRVIALAQKTLAKNDSLPEEPDKQLKLIKALEYLGLVALRDPIRDDVRETLQLTRQAGIRVIMVTGDHLLTAKAIGLELGFNTTNESVILGQELAALSERDLTKRLGRLEIIARVNPEHKLRIISAWQNQGAVVAMTGDGVNDAPALKAADIGVAVGSGTDVAKEAADLILLDDGFSTIAAAVQEGRTGFANIRKATVVVMSNAFTELILIATSLVFGTPFAITAVQILWVNLVEDGLPVLSMAFEPADQEIMRTRPTAPREPILNRQAKFIIFATSILGDLTLAGIFLYLLKTAGWDLVKLQSFIFMATATPTLLNIFAFKSLNTPLYKIKLWNNWFLVFSVILGIALMLAAIYLPPLNQFLKTVPLPLGAALASILAFPTFKLLLLETTKWAYRKSVS